MDVSRALEFARELSKGVLLTINADGTPQASNVLYAVLDDAVHVSVTDSRVKTRNVRRDPRAAMHISSDDFWSWVVLEGRVELSDVTRRPGDEAGAFLRQVYEAIAGPHPDWDDYDRAMIEDERLVLSVVVENAYGQLRG
ncbi:MAG TPA: PPOX class F420-dependent oxidoreductase [Acidimicrobiia bacterium]|nr:PPOX class F420-dependent oxidoreductase [Acidimicrobiia bacterium]